MKTLSMSLKDKFTLQNKNTALMVIDMQNDFCHLSGYNSYKLGLSLKLINKAKKKIIQLVEWSRYNKLQIIFTKESHREDLVDLTNSKRERYKNANTPIGDKGPMGRFLIRGYEGCELISEIKPFDKDLILDKTEHSCFVNTNLQNYLKEKNINNLIICGVTTQCCVLSTYRHSLDLGMDSLLIEDCCGAYDTKIHQSAINIINSEDGVLGKTLTLRELIN